MWRWCCWGVVIIGMTAAELPCLFSVAMAVGSPNVGDELAEELDRVGCELAAGVTVALPNALLPQIGPVPAAAVEELAGRFRWDRFTADSQQAPVAVTIKPVMAEGSRVGHQVRAAFTLRTRLSEHLAERDDSDRLGLGPVDAGGAARPLTIEELEKAGVKPAVDGNERFVFLEIRLLNRINLKGVIRIQRRVTSDSIEVAWAFDHRFDRLTDLATTAARIESNDRGERVIAPPQPYAGGGGIVRARTLADGETTASVVPVVIVESRLVFSEPESWFGGSNLLRAKIPLITQEGVRTLRRRMQQTSR